MPATVGAAGESSAAVLDWNVNATTAIVTVAKQPPAAAILSYAMVEGAVYDAVNAIDGRHQPYLAAPAANGSESKARGRGSRARRPRRALPGAARDARRPARDVPGRDPGGTAQDRRGGHRSVRGSAMIAARTNDGRFGPSVAVPGTVPGQWRPTLPAFASDRSWVGNVQPFLHPARRHVPLVRPERAHQRRLRPRLQRGQVDRLGDEHDPYRRPDRRRHLVARPRRRPMEPDARNVAAGQRLDITSARGCLR